jgi:nucleoside phosphorylase/tetratricopeptide (TPR) repeat protein
MTHEADILIVTVTEVETSAAIAAFKQANGFKEQVEQIRNRPYYNLGQIGSARVFLTQSEMGTGGLDGSLLTVSKGIEALSPLAVIMVGIAFGIDETKQRLGDILVAKQLRPYDLQKIGQDRNNWRGDKPAASPLLLGLFRTAERNWKVSDTSKVRFGTVLSGDKLIDNKDYRDLLLDFEPEAIGGEMEGAGLYAACHDEKVDWILVKGICDWADGNKSKDKESRQKMAASNAAAFVVSALKFVPIDWPQRRNGSQSGKTSLNLSFHLFERLQASHFNDYQLLCRLGCYRHKDIATLNKESILSLLWDMPQEVTPIKIIDSLCHRLLIEFKNNKYSLHSSIYWEAKRRLELNPEEWKNVNTQVAEFYSREVIDITKSTQVKTAHKAINHYHDAEKFEKCYEMLLNILGAKENLSNLRCSDNLWQHDSMIIEVCEQLIRSNGLKRSDIALTLIPLGVLYPEIGKNNKAIEVSKDILTIVNPLISDNPNDKKARLAEVSAYLVSGRANKNIGNVSEAKISCKEALERVKYTDKSVAQEWKAFALYELGTVHLETAKINEFFLKQTFFEAFKALYLIVISAFVAIGREIPKNFRNFFNRPSEIQNNADLIFKELENYTDTLEDNNYTKQFRILHSIGKCTRLMNIAPISRRFLKAALGLLPDTDDLNKAWSYLELALCSSTTTEAEEYYNRALGKYDNLKPICQAHFLFEYGNFRYKQEHYLQAIALYDALDKLLEDTEFESLKALNYYSICLSYSKLNTTDKITIENEIARDNVSAYLQKFQKACEQLSLPCRDLTDFSF